MNDLFPPQDLIEEGIPNEIRSDNRSFHDVQSIVSFQGFRNIEKLRLDGNGDLCSCYSSRRQGTEECSPGILYDRQIVLFLRSHLSFKKIDLPDKLSHKHVLGRNIELFRRSLLDDLAIFHDSDAVPLGPRSDHGSHRGPSCPTGARNL